MVPSRLIGSVALTAMIVSFMAAQPILADHGSEDTRPTLSHYGLRGGYLWLADDVQTRGLFERNFTYGIFYNAITRPGIGLEIAADFFSEKNRSSLSSSVLTVVPISATIKYYFYPSSAITPYFGGGVGYYLLEEKDDLITYLKTQKFGLHGVVGFWINASEQVALVVEIRRQFIEKVDSTYYYQANFGGLIGSLGIAISLEPPRPAIRPYPRVRTDDYLYPDAEDEFFLELDDIRRQIRILKEDIEELEYRERSMNVNRWEDHEYGEVRRLGRQLRPLRRELKTYYDREENLRHRWREFPASNDLDSSYQDWVRLRRQPAPPAAPPGAIGPSPVSPARNNYIEEKQRRKEEKRGENPPPAQSPPGEQQIQQDEESLKRQDYIEEKLRRKKAAEKQYNR